MNFTYKHIIWDWNGTLIDDAALCLEIINGLLYNRGLAEIGMRKYQEAFDFPVKNFYTNIGFNFSIEPFHVPATEYINEYNKRRFQCGLREGAVEALSFFRGAGMTQSILSASKRSSLEEAVSHYSIAAFFSHIIGLDDYYAAGKLEIGKEHLSGLGLPGSDIVIIGDTAHDCEVAKYLGTDCILVYGGHHNKRKLESCGVPVLDSLSEIKKMAEESFLCRESKGN